MRLTSLLLATLALSLPLASEAQNLMTRTDCTNLGAHWNPPSGASRLGECVFKQSYTVPRGQRFEVGPSIDLIIDNQATLLIEGQLKLNDSAHLIVANGLLSNAGYLQLTNRATMTLAGGNIVNSGELFSEGDIHNNVPTSIHASYGQGVYNSGEMIITDGGNFYNNGRFFSNSGGTLNVGPRGIFYNEGGSYFVPFNTLIDGMFINRWGGYIDNERRMTVRTGGHFENIGQMEIGGIGIPDKNGIDDVGVLFGDQGSVIVNRTGGKILSYHGQITTAGELINESATIENLTNSVIATTDSGAIYITGNGRIYIRPGGRVQNSGRLIVSCFAGLIDQGSYGGNPLMFAPCKDVSAIIPPRTLP